jgi:NTP pyrophosphatase (non-canonical NTP hydrolase)
MNNPTNEQKRPIVERSKYTNQQLREIFKIALHKWGQQFQLNMVAEECCELAKAVLKYNRKQNGSNEIQVIDEIADVYIMLGQLEVMLSLKIPTINTEINDTFDRKIERLMEMVQREE